jgi:hypothetical protein
LIDLSRNEDPKIVDANMVDKPIKKYPRTSITHIIEFGSDIENNSKPETFFCTKVSCK